MKKSGFLFRSAWPTIIRRSSHRFGAASYSFFPHRGKKQRKKVLFSWKSRFTDCPRKIAPASARRGEQEVSAQRYTITACVYIYIFIYKEILYRKGTENPCQDREVAALRLNPCFRWILLQGRLSFFLPGAVLLQASFAYDGQRVSLRVKHPVLKRQQVVIREQ